MTDTRICARALHLGDTRELKRLANIYRGPFAGNFWRMASYYKIRRPVLLAYLRAAL
jgi:hypothetical protein